MLLIYNILQLVALIVSAPVLFVKVILTPKYRSRIPKRLGFGLDNLLCDCPSGRPRIWIHALSLGEVSSSESLVKGVRESFPEAVILFSASTRAGEEFAKTILKKQVDVFVPFPFDLFWVVRRFINLIDPDLFVLIETDFWPNFLQGIKEKSIPSILVNGRFSQKSFAIYHQFRCFFKPIFNTFQFISMQTERDAKKMLDIGMPHHKVKALGNLKYDTVLSANASNFTEINREIFGIPEKAVVFVAGSTHAGEEELILNVYKKLVNSFPGLFLVIAPRDVDRGEEVLALAKDRRLSAYLRSDPISSDGTVLVLNTLGELAKIYSLCDISFVGGSLVEQGGHNPLEPAAFGKTVLFGPNMDDFAEIAEELLSNDGAVMVQNQNELFGRLSELLGDLNLRIAMGKQASSLVKYHHGVTSKHIDLIRQVLDTEKTV